MCSLSTSSRQRPWASLVVSARRSRTATGAVLWEMPRQRSSLMRFSGQPRRSRAARSYAGLLVSGLGGGGCAVLVGEPVELDHVALDPAQLVGHDADVDQQQRQEHEVGGGDVAGVV